MNARRWLVALIAAGCLLMALVAPMLMRSTANAQPRAFAPIKIKSIAHVSTVHGVTLAAEVVCNSLDRTVPVFVSLSWQDQLTTTIYANIGAWRAPGCHQVWLRAIQGDGHLVVNETPVQPNGLPGVTVTRASP